MFNDVRKIINNKVFIKDIYIIIQFFPVNNKYNLNKHMILILRKIKVILALI